MADNIRSVADAINIVDDVISSLYDEYEQEQEYSQKVIKAWHIVKNNTR